MQCLDRFRLVDGATKHIKVAFMPPETSDASVEGKWRDYFEILMPILYYQSRYAALNAKIDSVELIPDSCYDTHACRIDSGVPCWFLEKFMSAIGFAREPIPEHAIGPVGLCFRPTGIHFPRETQGARWPYPRLSRPSTSLPK